MAKFVLYNTVTACCSLHEFDIQLRLQVIILLMIMKVGRTSWLVRKWLEDCTVYINIAQCCINHYN